MGETSNTADLAEIISQRIFSKFYWERLGQKNINWECVKPGHDRKTHPSDAVFHYESPYEKERIYINFDLKSYKNTSIENKTNMTNTINELSKSVNCANNSKDWNERYLLKDQKNHQIYGSLFVYNYDGSYEKNLYDEIKEYKDIQIEEGTKIFIFSPQKIINLYSVAKDISTLTSSEEKTFLTNRKYSFYYPDLENRKKTNLAYPVPATIESFFAPWILVEYYKLSKKHNNVPKRKGFIIYYFEKGNTSEEFVYLIDYLFKYQLLTTNKEIYIRGVGTDSLASEKWNLAKATYGSRYGFKEIIKERLGNTKFTSIDKVTPNLSQVEIGVE